MPYDASLLHPADYRIMPWRNGLGTTTEIAVAPAADGRFHWRLSIADVAQSGPFSCFDGYDRVIAVASGAGMRLAVAGRPAAELTLTSAPYGFPGDAQTECTLIDGPIRDFNLITDRASTKGRVTAYGTGRHDVPLDGTGFLHALTGDWRLDDHAIPAGTTLRLDRAHGTAILTGPAGGRALLAIVTPV